MDPGNTMPIGVAMNKNRTKSFLAISFIAVAIIADIVWLLIEYYNSIPFDKYAINVMIIFVISVIITAIVFWIGKRNNTER
jgi:heme/copper-type cytochrome/quinol oxidase subunit 4